MTASCAAGCVIKAARETAALMFGVPVNEMLGRDLSEFLPNACPSRNAEDMLIVEDAGAKTRKGGLGAKKKVVGKLMPLVRFQNTELTHVGSQETPDTSQVLLEVLFAHHLSVSSK